MTDPEIANAVGEMEAEQPNEITQDPMTQRMLQRAALADRIFVRVPLSEAELEADPDYGL